MSNLLEYIAAYRDDIAVSDEWFTKMILEAHARDLTDAANAQIEAPGDPRDQLHALTQDERDQVNDHTLELLTDQGFVVNDHSGIRDLARNVDLANLMSPEESARYLLVQFRTVQETLDLLAAADGGLIELDTRREIALGALSERLDQLEQRMDLRAEECLALNARIENVTRLATREARLRPV